MTRTVEIAPNDVLQPGSRDARHLLTLWIVRQTAVPVFWLGLLVGVLVSPGHYLTVEYGSAGDELDSLASPAAGIALAILLRAGTSLAGVVLALPLARGFDAAGRAQGDYSGGRAYRVADVLGIARGYRSLRFTRYVRDAAVARLGDAGARYDRIDRGFKVAALALPVVCVVVILLA